MGQVKILNTEIDNILSSELLGSLQSHGGIVFTPNVDHIIKLQTDQDFYEAYKVADYRVCDSQILMYASKFLGTPIREKISGSDFFPNFCDYYRYNQDMRVFLLGGREGVAQKAQQRINLRVGRNIIIAAHSPSFGFEHNEEECQQIVDLINQSKATVLAIGVGAPKQEKWICKYKDQLQHVKVFLAIGATIDFEAGEVQRAPKWMSEMGLEWLYRLLSEPKRLWRRYLIDDCLPFLWLILRQKLNCYKAPPTLQINSMLNKLNVVLAKSASQPHRNILDWIKNPLL
ncbi:MAG: WecB/TagA/CpsF family glycosyltransferase [Cyanothece sp. SIO1E1]|nr:WecB/TagA/CpsF family glycosyltransferase [Cyanothece sp. SIO1E1]